MNKMDLMNDVFEELRRAEELHPAWPDNHFEALAIITEEIGELAQALIALKYSKRNFKQVKAEAVHAAAMSLRFLFNLEHRGNDE